MTIIRFPIILERRQCALCGETWGVKYHLFDAMTSRSKINSEIENMELTEAIHRNNHVLDRIKKEYADV